MTAKKAKIQKKATKKPAASKALTKIKGSFQEKKAANPKVALKPTV